jgi:hypothetical protein
MTHNGQNKQNENNQEWVANDLAICLFCNAHDAAGEGIGMMA